MGLQPIDNSNLVYMGREGSPFAQFTPAVGYTYDAVAKTIDAWDHSTFAAGDGLKRVHIRALDLRGGEVRASVETTGAGNKVTLDVSALDASRGLILAATVVCNKGLTADGSFRPILAAGELSSWNKGERKYPN